MEQETTYNDQAQTGGQRAPFDPSGLSGFPCGPVRLPNVLLADITEDFI
jgi:hypothetical protein